MVTTEINSDVLVCFKYAVYLAGSF